MKYVLILLISCLLLCSCRFEGEEEEEEYLPSSSSSTPLSSSSVVDLCADFKEGIEVNHYGKNKFQFCDARDGKRYVYVEIGTQTWMAENLNYDTTSSKCNDCATYGRLYDWTTAMILPSSCNLNYCYSEISSKHRGICPSGWHIPNIKEWLALSEYVDPNCTGAGCALINHLKTTSGWDSGNGQDTYGFAALPGGYGDEVGFGGVGYCGYWWGVPDLEGGEYTGFSVSLTLDRSCSENIPKNFHEFLSVRCVHD